MCRCRCGRRARRLPRGRQSSGADLL